MTKKYTRLETIGAALEMTEPHGDYKGGSISWEDSEWMHQQLKKLIKIYNEVDETMSDPFYELSLEIEKIEKTK